GPDALGGGIGGRLARVVERLAEGRDGLPHRRALGEDLLQRGPDEDARRRERQQGRRRLESGLPYPDHGLDRRSQQGDHSDRRGADRGDGGGTLGQRAQRRGDVGGYV